MRFFFRLICVIILTSALFVSGKKIHKSYLLKKLNKLQTVTLEGEEGFLEVNQWLILCNNLSLKNVTKYQTSLPKLEKTFLTKIQSPENWMKELLDQEFIFYKSVLRKDLIDSFLSFLSKINKKGDGTVNVSLRQRKEDYY